MSKPMSAREYRAHAQSFKAKAPTEIVTLSSGSVFELRRPDLMGYLSTGRIPQSLLALGMKAWKENGNASTEDVQAAIQQKMQGQELVDSLVFMREIVHQCCVNPKFVEFATEDDEIGAADMLPADFAEIYKWVMNHEGVAGLEGLQTFRQGQERRTSSDSTNGTELHAEAVSSAEN